MWDRWFRIKEAIGMWLFWKVAGWPIRRRCPSCAGTGTYLTESMARYGDEPYTCDQCKGSGFVKRRWFKL